MNVKGLLSGLSATLFFLLIPAPVAFSAEQDTNLVSNPGFEAMDPGKAGQPCNWLCIKRHVDEGDFFVVNDTVKTGKNAMKLEALKYSTPEPSSGLDCISIISDRFPAPPAKSVLKASAWLKAQDVKKGKEGYFKLRFVVVAWDAKDAAIKHWDIACTEGTFDWTKFEGSIIIPDGTKSLSTQIILTACTGTAWADDVEIKVVSTPDSNSTIVQQAKAVDGLILFPHPWQVQDCKKK